MILNIPNKDYANNEDEKATGEHCELPTMYKVVWLHIRIVCHTKDDVTGISQRKRKIIQFEYERG